MRNSLSIAAVCGFSLFSLSAMAGGGGGSSPHPTAIDADGDGYYAATVDVDGDGNIDEDDIGISADEYDCDDDHKSINPGAEEIIGDGHDQDCDGVDLVGKSDIETALFRANEYKNRTWSELVFIEEYARCDVATTAQCVVDTIRGVFVVKDGYAWEDLYRGVANDRIGRDGVREVLTSKDWENNRHALDVSSGGGLGTKSVTKIAKAEAEAVEDRALARDAEQDRSLDLVEAGSIARDVAQEDAILGNSNAIAVLETATTKNSQEVSRLQVALDDEIEDRVVGDARLALMTMDNAVNGPYFALTGGGGVIGQVEVPAIDPTTGGVMEDGSVVRGSSAPGVCLGLNFGADVEVGRANAFVDACEVSDLTISGERDDGLALTVGGEFLFNVAGSDFSVGPHMAGFQHEAGGDLLGVDVYSRGVLGGLSLAYELPIDGPFSVELFNRTSGGVESFGTRGELVIDGVSNDFQWVQDNAPVFRTTLGVAIGFGANND